MLNNRKPYEWDGMDTPWWIEWAENDWLVFAGLCIAWAWMGLGLWKGLELIGVLP